ncbi:phage tail protein [Cytobacillus firmus]|uniref:phage tail protein n=1 Tax=Cytobacillus firmus TaxID=1399 RepID=UPI0022283520|nr:phage tail protein [Cytobacillus firmus]
MFEVQNRQRETIGYIFDVFDDEINRTINEIYTLDFSIPLSDPMAAELRENRLIKYKSEHYLVRKVRTARDAENRKTKQIECELQPAELMDDVVESFVLVDRTAQDALTEALRNNRYGWQVGTVDVLTVRSLPETTYTNRWELLVSIREKWGGEFQYDTENMTISLLQNIGQDNGFIIAYSHNMKAIQCVSDYEDWGTRLYALGKDEITTFKVNGTGQNYVVSDTVGLYGVIDYVWKTDLETPEILFEASLKKLELIKHPRNSYIVNMVDLRKVPGYEGYTFSLGDTAKVKDKEMNIDVKSRVVSEREFPSTPEDFEVVIDTTPNNYKTLQEQLTEFMNRVKENSDVWDKAKLIDDKTRVEYGKVDYEVSPKPKVMFTNRYYSMPIVYLSLSKEDKNAANPSAAILFSAEFVTGLDSNNNITYDGVDINVIGGPSVLPGHKIAMWAFCNDPLSETL